MDDDIKKLLDKKSEKPDDDFFIFDFGKVKIKNNFCKTSEIAKFLNVSVRRVQQLAQDKIIDKVPTPKGERYDFFPTIQKLYKYQYDIANGKEKTKRETLLKERKLDAEADLKESQTELHQLKTAIFKGEYISKEEIATDYKKFFLVFKKFAMNIPNRIAGTLSTYCDTLEVRKIESELNKDITTALNKFYVAGHTPDEDNLMNEKKKNTAD